MAEYTSKEIAMTFFKKIREDVSGGKIIGRYQCCCGKERSQEISKGYSNLSTHVISTHPNYKDSMSARNKNNQEKNSISNFVTTEAELVFNWLEMITELNLPFTYVENQIFRNAVKYDEIGVDSILKYLSRVTEATKKKVAADLPAKFGVIIDGWTQGNQHYFGVYAAYDSDQYPMTRIRLTHPVKQRLL